MSEEIGDLLPDIGAVTPEKGNGSRYSTGLTPSPMDGKKGVPNYLRSSTGSCHDLCKFGRRHETETKPWSAGRRSMIDRKLPEKIVTTDEVLPDRKIYLKAKGQLSDSSCAGKQKMPSTEKRMMGSQVSKSKAPSKLKSSATPSCLSDPGRIVTERVSLDVEGSEQVSIKVTERRISGKLAIHSRSKTATTGPTSSLKSPASSRPRSKDRKAVTENTGISNRIRVSNAAIALTSSVPTKSSSSSALTSVKRKMWKPKTVIGPKNPKMAEDYRIQQIENQVPEKTLFVIGVESNNEGKSFDVSEISVENELPESEENGIISERPPSPSPSPSVAESLSQQNSSTHEEGKEGMENSCIQYSCQEEEEGGGEGEYDYDDHDEEEDNEEVGSEYSDGESETFSDLESNATQNKEEELTSTADGVRRRPREASVRVHPEGADGKPVKLKFRRGRVVEIQSDNSTPRRLKFRRRKSPGEDGARTRPQRRIPKKREVAANPDNVSDPRSEKYVLRSSGVQEKDRQGALFNNVIEETASKLVETRKSKVKALVGAFETVISLQDRKPPATYSG